MALSSLLTAACGNGGDGTPKDASASDAWQRNCWPGGGTPSSEVEIVLGTGIESFQPLEDEGTIVRHRGLQGGNHFELNARMRGFTPGDIDDNSVPSPHTLFRAFDQSGARVTTTECTFPRAYRDISAELGPGWYQLEYGSLVTLTSDFSMLPDQRVRIQLDVQDPTGRYAVTEHWLVVEDAPTTDVDAGVPDAGPVDATSP
jgi:hypothetical protein